MGDGSAMAVGEAAGWEAAGWEAAGWAVGPANAGGCTGQSSVVVDEAAG